jgi:thiol-disulfide isomerase/thioredoxin
LLTINGCLTHEVREIGPDFTLVDIDGNNFTLSNYRGMVVLINFMATWCVPCKEEMPELVAIYEKHGNEVIMISIDTDLTESREDLRRFKQEHQAEWVFALDNLEEDVRGKYEVLGIPTTFIIDTDGYISYMHYGPVKEIELIKEIEKAGGRV